MTVWADCVLLLLRGQHSTSVLNVYCLLGLPGRLGWSHVPSIWNRIWKQQGLHSDLMESSVTSHDISRLAWWRRILLTLWKAVWSTLESHRMGLDQRGRHWGPGRRAQLWLVLKAWEDPGLLSWLEALASAPAELHTWIALLLAYPCGLTPALTCSQRWDSHLLWGWDTENPGDLNTHANHLKVGSKAMRLWAPVSCWPSVGGFSTYHTV